MGDLNINRQMLQALQGQEVQRLANEILADGKVDSADNEKIKALRAELETAAKADGTVDDNEKSLMNALDSTGLFGTNKEVVKQNLTRLTEVHEMDANNFNFNVQTQDGVGGFFGGKQERVVRLSPDALSQEQLAEVLNESGQTIRPPVTQENTQSASLAEQRTTASTAFQQQAQTLSQALETNQEAVKASITQQVTEDVRNKSTDSMLHDMSETRESMAEKHGLAPDSEELDAVIRQTYIEHESGKRFSDIQQAVTRAAETGETDWASMHQIRRNVVLPDAEFNQVLANFNTAFETSDRLNDIVSYADRDLQNQEYALAQNAENLLEKVSQNRHAYASPEQMESIATNASTVLSELEQLQSTDPELYNQLIAKLGPDFTQRLTASQQKYQSYLDSGTLPPQGAEGIAELQDLNSQVLMARRVLDTLPDESGSLTNLRASLSGTSGAISSVAWRMESAARENYKFEQQLREVDQSLEQMLRDPNLNVATRETIVNQLNAVREAQAAIQSGDEISEAAKPYLNQVLESVSNANHDPWSMMNMMDFDAWFWGGDACFAGDDDWFSTPEKPPGIAQQLQNGAETQTLNLALENLKASGNETLLAQVSTAERMLNDPNVPDETKQQIRESLVAANLTQAGRGEQMFAGRLSNAQKAQDLQFLTGLYNQFALPTDPENVSEVSDSTVSESRAQTLSGALRYASSQLTRTDANREQIYQDAQAYLGNEENVGNVATHNALESRLRSLDEQKQLGNATLELANSQNADMKRLLGYDANHTLTNQDLLSIADRMSSEQSLRTGVQDEIARLDTELGRISGEIARLQNNPRSQNSQSSEGRELRELQNQATLLRGQRQTLTNLQQLSATRTQLISSYERELARLPNDAVGIAARDQINVMLNHIRNGTQPSEQEQARYGATRFVMLAAERLRNANPPGEGLQVLADMMRDLNSGSFDINAHTAALRGAGVPQAIIDQLRTQAEASVDAATNVTGAQTNATEAIATNIATPAILAPDGEGEEAPSSGGIIVPSSVQEMDDAVGGFSAAAAPVVTGNATAPITTNTDDPAAGGSGGSGSRPSGVGSGNRPFRFPPPGQPPLNIGEPPPATRVALTEQIAEIESVMTNGTPEEQSALLGRIAQSATQVNQSFENIDRAAQTATASFQQIEASQRQVNAEKNQILGLQGGGAQVSPRTQALINEANALGDSLILAPIPETGGEQFLNDLVSDFLNIIRDLDYETRQLVLQQLAQQMTNNAITQFYKDKVDENNDYHQQALDRLSENFKQQIQQTIESGLASQSESSQGIAAISGQVTGEALANAIDNVGAREAVSQMLEIASQMNPPLSQQQQQRILDAVTRIMEAGGVPPLNDAQLGLPGLSNPLLRDQVVS